MLIRSKYVKYELTVFNKDDETKHLHLQRVNRIYSEIIFVIDFVVLHTLLRGNCVFQFGCIYQLLVIEHFI